MTKNSLIEAARRVFWKQGITNTTVDDICEIAGYSKMTFYRAYNNKYDIVREIIDEAYDQLEYAFDDIFNRDIPLEEKIKELLYFNYNTLKEVSEEFIKDIVKQEHPKLKDYMQTKLDAHQSVVIKYIRKEQKKGNIRKDVDSEFVKFFLDHINELIFDERLRKIYNSADEIVMQMTKILYFGIIAR